DRARPRAAAGGRGLFPGYGIAQECRSRGLPDVGPAQLRANRSAGKRALGRIVISSEAKQSPADRGSPDGDCFVAALLAMTTRSRVLRREASMIEIPARQGKALRLRRGQKARVVNTKGQQVVDTWAFNTADLTEF